MGKSILIIDDDQSLVAPLKEGLETLGYRVAVAFDGLQGVLQAHQFQPDLVILDFYMPGGGGGSVYERLRQAKETAQTPIVFSTVVSVEEVKGRIRPSANTYFLRKPVGLNQIVSVIRSVLGEQPSETRVSPPPPAAPEQPSPGRRVHEYRVRVSYGDTDRMGVVYYANYLRFFESARTELLRSLGARYRDLEAHRKLFLPVSEASCQYLQPARYDDLLLVRTCIAELGKASVIFSYEVADAEDPRRRLALGRTRHAVINELWKPTRLPQDLRTALSAFLAPQA